MPINKLICLLNKNFKANLGTKKFGFIYVVCIGIKN